MTLWQIATQISNLPRVSGLTSADLIAILAVVVTIFGLLLTAIGVLVLRQFTGLDSRLSEVKADTAAALAEVKTEARSDNQAIWRELALVRSWVMGTPAPRTPGPLPIVDGPPRAS